jgi:hypothetical protein
MRYGPARLPQDQSRNENWAAMFAKDVADLLTFGDFETKGVTTVLITRCTDIFETICRNTLVSRWLQISR